MTDVQKIIDYENGELSFDDTVSLFQELVDDGTAWHLQGTYGRTADALIREGLVTMPETPSSGCKVRASAAGVELARTRQPSIWEHHPKNERYVTCTGQYLRNTTL